MSKWAELERLLVKEIYSLDYPFKMEEEKRLHLF